MQEVLLYCSALQQFTFIIQGIHQVHFILQRVPKKVCFQYKIAGTIYPDVFQEFGKIIEHQKAIVVDAQQHLVFMLDQVVWL